MDPLNGLQTIYDPQIVVVGIRKFAQTQRQQTGWYKYNNILSVVFSKIFSVPREDNKYTTQSSHPILNPIKAYYSIPVLTMSYWSNDPPPEEFDVKIASFRSLHERRPRVCSYEQHEIKESTKPAMEFLSRLWGPSAFDSVKQTRVKGNFLTRLVGSRKEKKKEETRLHTAELHAALSLTQLAAAIAGISSSMSTPQNSPSNGEWDKDMGTIISSYSTVILTAFTEIAGSLGAKREQVGAAVDSGMAIQSPIDMMSATAMAATCLRGASLLRSRAIVEPLFRPQQMLKVGAQICIIMPSGRKECSRISLYLKHQNLVFSLKKKYLGGALTSTKECIPSTLTNKVTNMMEERLKCEESCFLCLKTNNGIIKLSFEDEAQSRFWMSTIFNLLEMRNQYGQSSRKLLFSD